MTRSAALLALGLAGTTWATETRIVAHRGASAYLPEHTREAYLLAYGQGADYLEPDLVMTRDGVLVARHDLTLEETTDVESVFPGRARDDGRWYVVDFTLAELRRLNVHERVVPATGNARWPGRWPPARGRFGIVTFDELVEFVVELNRATGRTVGVYPELKRPAFHAEHGMDMTAALLASLDRHELPHANLPVLVQCFVPGPLEAIRRAHGDRFELIQLIGEASWGVSDVDYDAMRSAEGLARVAGYADGIGVPIGRLVEPSRQAGLRVLPLLAEARRTGLAVHPFTFRRESMPTGVTLEAMLELFIDELAVDALFTDHPDVAVAIRRAVRERRSAGRPVTGEAVAPIAVPNAAQ
jgi:glycerophosphoryl diester phosphodiesterase